MSSLEDGGQIASQVQKHFAHTHESPQHFPAQTPQLTVTPQLLIAVPQMLVPQGSDAVHPHLYGVPPPPHVCLPLQVPQLGSVPPQPSGGVPHVAPTPAHVFGVQPQVPAVPPPPHDLGLTQPPQSRAPPQLSVMVPHLPVQSKTGLQPQTLVAPPPPHVAGAVQAPQSCVPPQPSGMVPHLPVQLNVGVQPQTPAVPPPPHV